MDDAEVTRAVANALTVALAGPDTSTYAGQNSHYLLPALGTANGMTAALLTAAGMEPPDNALRHAAEVAHDQAVPDLDLGDSPLIDLAYLKPIGVCAHALTAWEATQELRPQVGLDEISGILVRTYAGAARLSATTPSTLLGRQFSIPWVVASALAGRDVDAPATDLVRRLAASTQVVHDPALDSAYPASRPAHLEIRSTSGARHAGFAEFHRGDRERPLTDEELERVDEDLLVKATGNAGAKDIHRALGGSDGTPWRQIVRITPGRTAAPTSGRREGA
jgi:2-methylcitrate dehydratase PrpD